MKKSEVQREPNLMKISRSLKGYVRAPELDQVKPYVVYFSHCLSYYTVKIFLLPCVNRKQTSPAKLCWRWSVKRQNIFSPIQQQELSLPCSTRCPKSEARWRVQGTRSLRAFWEKPCWNMVEIWGMTLTLVSFTQQFEISLSPRINSELYFQITQALAYRLKRFICLLSDGKRCNRSSPL